MKITVIAALAENRVIGINNTLPWKLSADLKRFKTLTSGHTILMGRKTFESLGRPLPGRIHVCISRAGPKDTLSPDPRWPEQVFWCGDLIRAIDLLTQQQLPQSSDPLFIIGGADIYSQALPMADTLELTHIDLSVNGDAYFPFYENLFHREHGIEGDENGLHYSFATYSTLRPAGVRVRTACQSDVDFIVRSQLKMAMESENVELASTTVSKGVSHILAAPALGEYLIAEVEEANGMMNPIGCLLLQREWSDWRNADIEWMHSVHVEPAYRRKGVFRWMHAVATARARTRGAQGLRLYVDKRNQAAQGVYKALGMSKEHYDLFEKMF